MSVVVEHVVKCLSDLLLLFSWAAQLTYRLLEGSVDELVLGSGLNQAAPLFTQLLESFFQWKAF